MSNAPIYFRFFIDDYLRDADELSVMRHGAYLRLMLWYYGRAKPIPNDLTRVYYRCGARSRDEEDAVRSVLEEFFVLREGFWTHSRIDAELNDWRTRSDLARRSVLAREQKRHKINESTSSNDDRTMIERSSNQNQNQSKTKAKSKPTSAHAPPDRVNIALWGEWTAYKGRKLTPRAYAMQCKFLALQPDPNACIEQSLRNSWQGLFPTERTQGERRKSASTQAIDNGIEALKILAQSKENNDVEP